MQPAVIRWRRRAPHLRAARDARDRSRSRSAGTPDRRFPRRLPTSARSCRHAGTPRARTASRSRRRTQSNRLASADNTGSTNNRRLIRGPSGNLKYVEHIVHVAFLTADTARRPALDSSGNRRPALRRSISCAHTVRNGFPTGRDIQPRPRRSRINAIAGHCRHRAAVRQRRTIIDRTTRM